MEDIVTIVKMIGSEVGKTNPGLLSLVQERLTEHGTIAPIQEFVRSPLTRGYRNKVEFSVGYAESRGGAAGENGDVDAAGPKGLIDRVSVGFRLATYKQGKVLTFQHLLKRTQVVPSLFFYCRSQTRDNPLHLEGNT